MPTASAFEYIPAPGFRLNIDADGIDVSASGDGAQVQAQFGGEVRLPGGFPEDVPVFPNATLTSSVSSPAIGTMLTYQVEESPEEVHAFYRRELLDDGWTIESEMNIGGQFMVSFDKERRKASVAITRDASKGTKITLTIANLN